MAKLVRFSIEGIAPFSFSKVISSVKSTGEAHDAFEERTWRERMHVNAAGHAFIPPAAMKHCLADCAKYLSETVPGKGKATFTKHFKAGIMVTEPMVLEDRSGKPIVAEDVEGELLFVPSNGQAGHGMRVFRRFPVIPEWQTHGEIHVLDPVLIDKPGKIREYMEHGGNFIGMGRFRPINAGFYGRFKVTAFES